MPPKVKSSWLQVRMSADQLAGLHALADERGTTASAIVRDGVAGVLAAAHKRRGGALSASVLPSPVLLPPVLKTRGDRGNSKKKRRK
jgi:hypothetical protein